MIDTYNHPIHLTVQPSGQATLLELHAFVSPGTPQEIIALVDFFIAASRAGATCAKIPHPYDDRPGMAYEYISDVIIDFPQYFTIANPRTGETLILDPTIDDIMSANP